MDKKDILSIIKKENVKFVSLQFTDISGSVKSVDFPVSIIDDVLTDGMWFDGSSIHGFMRIQESDMRLMPDLDTFAVLPWTPDDTKRARVFCDILTPEGDPFEADPRYVLKKQIKRLEDKGWVYNIGAEPEFFLFKKVSDEFKPVPHDVGGYFDFSPNDDAVQVRSKLMVALADMGLEIEMGHHEVAIGQHEIDFKFSDALKAADQILTMKYTVKAIAAQAGLIASFMPKPMFGANGSGMHCHQSIFTKDGDNVFFDDKDPMKLSDVAYKFIAGQLNHARALSAVVAPTVNSYKRLVPGYEAPVYIGWAQRNRSALIRMPRYFEGRSKAVRLELRFPDPSANPYLAIASMLAAGLDGIESNMECPANLNDVNIYDLDATKRSEMGIGTLPGSLSEALSELDKDAVLKNALGEKVYDVFYRTKFAEAENYRLNVTGWEIEKYLETA